jgi:hypothetical protein
VDVEWIALVVGALGLVLQALRAWWDRARDKSTDRRLEAAEARLETQDRAQFLLELEQALGRLYERAREQLHPAGATYATDAALSRQLVETENVAKRAQGEIETASLDFVDQCKGLLGWGDKPTPDVEKESKRKIIEEAFKRASGTIAASRSKR